jgi:hypothetical protein
MQQTQQLIHPTIHLNNTVKTKHGKTERLMKLDVTGVIYNNQASNEAVIDKLGIVEELPAASWWSYKREMIDSAFLTMSTSTNVAAQQYYLV